MIESFWSTTRRELLDTRVDTRAWATPTQLSCAIFECIKARYTSRRRHASIDNLSPAVLERLYGPAATAS